MTGYGAIKATGEGVSLVFQSTDDAHTWSVRSMVHGPRGINEMAMARTSDGRLLGLFRENGSPSGLLQLYPIPAGLLRRRRPDVDAVDRTARAGRSAERGR